MGTLLCRKRQKMWRGTILSYYVATARRFGSFPFDKRTSDDKITQMNSSFFVPPILFGIFVLWYSNFILETISISFKLFSENGNDQSQNIKILCKTDGTDSAEGYCCSFYSFTLTMHCNVTFGWVFWALRKNRSNWSLRVQKDYSQVLNTDGTLPPSTPSLSQCNTRLLACLLLPPSPVFPLLSQAFTAQRLWGRRSRQGGDRGAEEPIKGASLHPKTYFRCTWWWWWWWMMVMTMMINWTALSATKNFLLQKSQPIRFKKLRRPAANVLFIHTVSLSLSQIRTQVSWKYISCSLIASLRCKYELWNSTPRFTQGRLRLVTLVRTLARLDVQLSQWLTPVSVLVTLIWCGWRKVFLFFCGGWG